MIKEPLAWFGARERKGKRTGNEGSNEQTQEGEGGSAGAHERHWNTGISQCRINILLRSYRLLVNYRYR